MYKVYGKPNCYACNKAKSLLDSKGLSYEYVEIGKDISRDNFIAKYPDQKTVPMIFLDHAVLGSYEQLVDYLK